MNHKAISKYFWDINIFNLPFSLIFGLIAGLLWSVVIFSSLGILIGYLAFHTFKKNEYYTYYNLGFTKAYLLKKVWLLNLSISILIFTVYILLR